MQLKKFKMFSKVGIILALVLFLAMNFVLFATGLGKYIFPAIILGGLGFSLIILIVIFEFVRQNKKNDTR